jgi:hypothetical protein
MRLFQEDKDSFLQLVRKDVSKGALLSALRGTDLIVTYNGRSIPDKMKGYTGSDFPVIAAQLVVVLDEEFKHVDLCPVCWQRGLWGGQKTIERSLGLKRKLPGRDGAWADVTWKKYETTGYYNFLEELLEYNREDVFMLRRIQEALRCTENYQRPRRSCVVEDSDARNEIEGILIASMPTANSARPRIKKESLPTGVRKMVREIERKQANPSH